MEVLFWAVIFPCLYIGTGIFTGTQMLRALRMVCERDTGRNHQGLGYQGNCDRHHGLAVTSGVFWFVTVVVVFLMRTIGPARDHRLDRFSAEQRRHIKAARNRYDKALANEQYLQLIDELETKTDAIEERTYRRALNPGKEEE